LIRVQKVTSASSNREPYTPCARALSGISGVSGIQSPLISTGENARWAATIRRNVARSRAFHPTHAEKTLSQTRMPTPFTQADCNSSL